MNAADLLSPEQRARLAEQLGDAKPASAGLVVSFGKSIVDIRTHEHPTWEDLYCLNLTSYMGERMGPVLRRLLDAEARMAELEASAAAHQRKGYEAAIEVMRQEKLPMSVGLLEAQLELNRLDGLAPSLTVFRASHDSIPMGRYTTREAARKHCETLARREANGSALDWRVDEPSEDDSPEELWDLGLGPDDEWFATGYVVTPLEIASEYDPDGDE